MKSWIINEFVYDFLAEFVVPNLHIHSFNPLFFITPRACARGKAIVCRRRRRHENRQIASSRHLCEL